MSPAGLPEGARVAGRSRRARIIAIALVGAGAVFAATHARLARLEAAAPGATAGRPDAGLRAADAGQREDACVRFCLAIAAVKCASDGDCRKTCPASIGTVGPRCRARWLEYLRCLGQQPASAFTCQRPAGKAVPRPDTCLDQRQTYTSCGANPS